MNATAAVCAPAQHAWAVALTTLNPTAGDLRLRAAFWRRYLGEESHNLSAEQCRAVYANCVEMLALADRMQRPAPVAVLVPKRNAVKPAVIGAEQFWTLHGQAVRNMIEAHGLSWRNNVPHETVEITLPPRLCSYVGPLGGRIRWRRDHRVPAAKYWPGGNLPEGVEALPVAPRYDGPMGDDHPGMVAWHASIGDDVRQRRGDASWNSPGWPPMLRPEDANEEASRLCEEDSTDG